MNSHKRLTSNVSSKGKDQREPEPDLLSRVLDEGRLARGERQTERAKDMIAEFVQQVMEGQMTISLDMQATINARIAAIDKLISVQLNEIKQAEEFQKLESFWRALHNLVFNTETEVSIEIVFNQVEEEEQITEDYITEELMQQCIQKIDESRALIEKDQKEIELLKIETRKVLATLGI